MKEAVAELFNHTIIDDTDPNSLIKEFLPDLSKELQKKYALTKNEITEKSSKKETAEVIKTKEQNTNKKTKNIEDIAVASLSTFLRKR